MNARWLVALLVSLGVGLLFFYAPETDQPIKPCLINPMEAGTIILLNGVSSVGKSSTQRALQELMAEPYLALGTDTFLVGLLPNQLFTGDFLQRQRPEVVEGMHGYYEQEGGKQVYKLEFGPAALHMVRGMHQAFAAFARERNNLVIDYILYDSHWLADLVMALHNYRVYFIGLQAPIEIIEQREQARGTSPVGHARAYYASVHKHGEYDLLLDTAQLSPVQTAQAIKDFVEKNPEPKAFARLYKKLVK